MWTMDNNQRGYPLKYQRFRSSNTFVEVTVRTCVKGKICDNSIVDGHEKWAPISYVDQLIVNPINFVIFDKKVMDMTSITDICHILLRDNKFVGVAVKIDMMGTRLLWYTALVNITNTMTSTVVPYMIGYNKSKYIIKSWRLQSAKFKTDHRNNLLKWLYSEHTDYYSIARFQ